MLQIVSKSVTALKNAPLIDEVQFDLIQEQMNGEHPNSSKKKKYDSGKPKLTHFDDWLGFGSNDRGVNPGVGSGLGRDPNESANHDLTSGYNDGGQANDETGPGNSSTMPDPYYTTNVSNELFMKLRMDSGERDSPYRYMTKLRTSTPVKMPKRYKQPILN